MKTDEYFMGNALAEAQKAAQEGEVPVGAVIVCGGKILSRGHNRSVKRADPTAHAEIQAIGRACLKRKNYRLPDCELFVTLEPCPMCLGAIVQARVKRLVFAAFDPKAGAVGSVMSFPWAKMNHRPEIQSGVRGEECARALKDFFKNKRGQIKRNPRRPWPDS
jgi:tRNA(adenine34) deaminase